MGVRRDYRQGKYSPIDFRSSTERNPLRFEEEENSDRSIVARVFDSKQTSVKRETPLNAPVSLLTNFSANILQFEYI